MYAREVVQNVLRIEQQKAAKNKKIKEIDIIESLEKSCNPDEDDGEWITKYDLVEKGKRLRVVNMNEYGRCKTECRTMEAACQELLEDFDVSDLSSKIARGNRDPASLAKWLCNEETSACSGTPPPLPKSRTPGESHQPMDSDERQAQQTLRSLKSAGLSGQMYNRDNLADELDEIQKQYEDDDDFEFIRKDIEDLKAKAKEGTLQDEYRKRFEKDL